MLELVRSIFFEYSNFIVLLPLLIAAINQKNYTKELKLVFYYLLLATVTQTVSFALWKQSIKNLPILHIYTIAEALLLLWFYSVILKNFIPRFVFVALSIAFAVFSFIDSIYIEGIYAFNTYGRSIEALIFIFMAISWFVKIVGEDEDERQAYKGINYINSGFLIYFSASVVLFAFSNYINRMAGNFSLNIWTIHTFLTVQLYILIAIGLWKAKTR